MPSTIDRLTDGLRADLTQVDRDAIRGAVAHMVTQLGDNFELLDDLVAECGWGGIRRSSLDPPSQQTGAH